MSLVEHEIRWNIDGGDFTFIDMVSHDCDVSHVPGGVDQQR